MNSRFLIDYDNPDAGIGHSMGIINRALKIAARNNLDFAYSEGQLIKSHQDSLRWKIKQILRTLRGKKRDETHNIGNDLNRMLSPKNLLVSREEIESRIRRGELKVIPLPEFEIHIPSNQQVDDKVYSSIDHFIQSHPESNVVFTISRNRFGDHEYEASRDWFIKAYIKAQEQHPIPLKYDSSKVNIAIHIRRGDLLPSRQFSDLSSRMLPDSWYLNVLQVVTAFSIKPIAIHIFSEGWNGQYISENGLPFSWQDHFKATDFEVSEYIDTSFIDTFHHLLHADILIGSKSGMSHLAGMLGEQIKIMPEMWHSYRDANKTLLLGNGITEAETSVITQHLAQNLLD